MSTTQIKTYKGVWKSRGWVKSHGEILVGEEYTKPGRLDIVEGMEVLINDFWYEVFLYNPKEDEVYLVKAEELDNGD